MAAAEASGARFSRAGGGCGVGEARARVAA
jgi:hypothetical protein